MIELLKRLSEIAPDVCEQIEKDAIYARNIYFDGHKCVSAIGDDAWLQLALQRAIEARGWYWELRYSPIDKQYKAEVCNLLISRLSSNEALLTAFILALEAEKSELRNWRYDNE